jgi:DNA-binding CsgD family transcriptional regulator
MRPRLKLTPRQLEVLRLLALGLTDRQIAERLAISPATARTHVERIRELLRANTRRAAVAAARMEGLLGETTPDVR